MPVTIEAASDSSQPITVRISGEMTVTYAAEIRECLIAAFNGGESVVVDLTDVSEIDVSGLQLLCSAHRSSLSMQKKYRIVARGKDTIWEAAGLSGQLRQRGCAQDICGTCIWTGGKES